MTDRKWFCGTSASTILVCAIVAAASIVMLSTSLMAQPIWLNQGQTNALAIEILKPELKFTVFTPSQQSSTGYSFLSSAIFLSGRFSINENSMFVGELPFAYADPDVATFSFLTGSSEQEEGLDAQAAIGNPYLGLEVSRPNSAMFAELGVRLPLASEDKLMANSLGASADFDRFEAFAPDILTLLGKINFYHKKKSPTSVRLRGGPTLLINTAGNGETADILLDYSARVEYAKQDYNLMAGITGRLLVSESGLDLGERTFHHLVALAGLTIGRFRPAVMFRLPIDDELNDTLVHVFGLNLGVELK